MRRMRLKNIKETKNILLLVVLCFCLFVTACSNTIEEVNNNTGINDLENGDAQLIDLNVDVDVYEQAKNIGRALNIGNALEAPFEGSWDLVIKEEYFKLIKDKGFDSIRVPIRFSNKTTTESPYTIDENFMKRVDWVIEQSALQELNVIIDLHHFDELLADPYGNKERFLSIWEQISSRYSNQPLSVYYEILNEPHSSITSSLWNEYLLEAIDIVRQHDPNRTLIIGGIDWNSINGLYQLKLPEEDRNIIATIHYYGPMLFTHQGAEWMTAEYGTKGLVWPGPPETPVEPTEAAQQVDWVNNFFKNYNTKTGADNPASEEALVRDLEHAAKWGEINDRPIFLGEFGVYRTADIDSRVAWTKKVRLEAERLGISWAYWEFAAGYGVYNRTSSSWNEQLIDALFSSQ